MLMHPKLLVGSSRAGKVLDTVHLLLYILFAIVWSAFVFGLVETSREGLPKEKHPCDS